MKIIIREITFPAFLEHGWGNGYVLIPKGHPLYKMGYNKIEEKYNIDVHGGLTFAELVTKKLMSYWIELEKSDIGKWMVGFDTCHYMDNELIWTKENVLKETERLKEQLEKI